MQTCSLLNSILGPVMRGPSSSHTAAPFFIAKTARELSTTRGEQLISARVLFDPKGSFAEVYKNQGSDQGFAAGLFGREMNGENYEKTLSDIAKTPDFHLEFLITPLQDNSHPNNCELELTVRKKDNTKTCDTWQAVSTGGGMFTVYGLNKHKIHISGDTFTLIIQTAPEQIQKIQDHLSGLPNLIQKFKSKASNIIEAAITRALTSDEINILSIMTGVKDIRQALPSQLSTAGNPPLVSSAAEILKLSKTLSLNQIAEQFEASQLGISKEKVREHFDHRLQTMEKAIHDGLSRPTESNKMKFLKPVAKKMRDAFLPPQVGGDFMHQAITGALAVMESGTQRGLVCAAPTAGSAGIIPGICHALLSMGMPRPKVIEALEVMALIGAIAGIRATFAAEVAGCAAETGISAAMAAAGLAHAHGASPEQAMDAAALCMMNTTGLVCDPLGGEVEIPCHARNIGGVSQSIAAATAVSGGFQAVIPLDEMIDSMMSVASKMHADLRCTARGGCAKTPTAHKLASM